MIRSWAPAIIHVGMTRIKTTRMDRTYNYTAITQLGVFLHAFKYLSFLITALAHKNVNNAKSIVKAANHKTDYYIRLFAHN